MASVHARIGALRVLEWFFTLAISAEYIARPVSVRCPLRCATSFFGARTRIRTPSLTGCFR